MITITKKESSLVWMLRKAKTARLVITLYRHITDKLPTSYRHITNCRPTDSLCFGENLSAVSRPSLGRQTADSRPTDGRQSADSRPTVGRQSANRRPTVGRQSADRFFGELFFTITQMMATNSPENSWFFFSNHHSLRKE